MKHFEILLAVIAVLVLSSCTLNPEVDLRIESVTPGSLTVTGAGQTVTITIEIRNGVEVEIQGYSLKYYYYDTKNKKKNIDITHRANLTSTIEGGTYSDGSWETSMGTVDILVTYTDIIAFAQDNNLEQITAEIYIQGRDLNANDFEIDDAYVALYF